MRNVYVRHKSTDKYNNQPKRNSQYRWLKHCSRRIWQPAFADHHCGPGKPPTTSTGGGATKTITDIWGKKQSNKTHPTTPLSSLLPYFPPQASFLHLTLRNRLEVDALPLHIPATNWIFLSLKYPVWMVSVWQKGRSVFLLFKSFIFQTLSFWPKYISERKLIF